MCAGGRYFLHIVTIIVTATISVCGNLHALLGACVPMHAPVYVCKFFWAYMCAEIFWPDFLDTSCPPPTPWKRGNFLPTNIPELKNVNNHQKPGWKMCTIIRDDAEKCSGSLPSDAVRFEDQKCGPKNRGAVIEKWFSLIFWINSTGGVDSFFAKFQDSEPIFQNYRAHEHGHSERFWLFEGKSESRTL